MEAIHAVERRHGDAMRGTLMRREDGVDAAEQMVDPALRTDRPVHPYGVASRGLPEADPIVAAAGGERAPMPAA